MEHLRVEFKLAANYYLLKKEFFLKSSASCLLSNHILTSVTTKCWQLGAILNSCITHMLLFIVRALICEGSYCGSMGVQTIHLPYTTEEIGPPLHTRCHRHTHPPLHMRWNRPTHLSLHMRQGHLSLKTKLAQSPSSTNQMRYLCWHNELIL